MHEGLRRRRKQYQGWCMCAHERVCVRACAHVSVCVCVPVRTPVSGRVCARAQV